MRWLRQALRLPLLIGLLLLGLMVQVLVQPWLGQERRRHFIGLWSRGLLRACGVRLVERHVPQACVRGAALAEAAASGMALSEVPKAAGAPAGEQWPDETRQYATAAVEASAEVVAHCPHPDASVAGASSASGAQPSLATLAPGRMLVANHQSWLDIFAINALAPSAFVAKSEIRRWPLAGWLVAMAGTVFIERGRRHAVADAVQQLRQRLASGYPVAFFPEAVVHCGPSLKPFHGNLFEAAIAEQAEIVPIAIRYQNGHDGSPGTAAWYDGDISFARSVLNVLGAPQLTVVLHVLLPVPSTGQTRQALARSLRGQIGAVLGKDS